MSNVDDRAFSIMIPLQILRKLDPVLYVWSNSEFEGKEDEVIVGLTDNYHVAHIIGDVLLHYILLSNYRDILQAFQIIVTAYVGDTNRKNAGYIYD